MSGPSTRLPERYFSAICTDGVFRIRTRATIGLKTENGLEAVYRRASALFASVAGSSPFGNVIAAFLPRWRNWREPVEHTQPIKLRVPAFISQGLRLICKLDRLPYGPAGKAFLLRSLVQYPQKSDGCGFHRFQFSPVLSLSAVHAHTKAWSSQHDAQRKRASRTGE